MLINPLLFKLETTWKVQGSWRLSGVCLQQISQRSAGAKLLQVIFARELVFFSCVGREGDVGGEIGV